MDEARKAGYSIAVLKYMIHAAAIMIQEKRNRTNWNVFEFSLNVFTELSEFSDKNICHYSKRT